MTGLANVITPKLHEAGPAHRIEPSAGRNRNRTLAAKRHHRPGGESLGGAVALDLRHEGHDTAAAEHGERGGLGWPVD